MSKLAIEGGKPVRKRPFPTVDDRSGRTLGKEEARAASEVIMSGHLFVYGGTKVDKFEKEFAKRMGVSHGIASTSGTAAIHVALGALGVSPGDEVITSPITDMGTIIPIIFQGAVPIFADVFEESLNVDPSDVKRKITDKTAAIVPVHLFGLPADMGPILDAAEERGIPVVEDCCQAYLAEYGGKLTGSIGKMGTFSLQQSKHMTTGDGGMTITNDDELAERAALFADKGWDRSKGREYVMLGINYRMTEVHAAIGLEQLKKLRFAVESRRKSATRLTRQIEGIKGLVPPRPPKGVKHSYWQYPLIVDDELGISPKRFSEALVAEGVPASYSYIGEPMYLKTPLREKKTFAKNKHPFDCPAYGRPISYAPGLCPSAEAVLKKLIVIPWNEKYTKEDVDDIAEAIQKVAAHSHQL
jgi:dTDP-4-amino-4,6-dideoxygalactose transaminase